MLNKSSPKIVFDVLDVASGTGETIRVGVGTLTVTKTGALPFTVVIARVVTKTNEGIGAALSGFSAS